MKKNLIIGLMSVITIATITSCGNKKPIQDGTPTTTTAGASGAVVLKGEITADTKLTADKIYLLEGTVLINSGATLTIEPGTIIKGDKATKGSLVVGRGGKLMAVGTIDKPIVMTSNLPAGARAQGDWGGLILLGKAPVNQGSNVSIEGLPADDKYKYGGADANDNSGKLKYLRVEYAGIPYGPDNEINGVTFGGVGAGTEVDFVQVYRSGDDAFEFFGGTVNCKHLLAIDTWDDDFDTDFGYSGKLQFLIAQRLANTADVSGSNGFESDNNGSGTDETPKTKAIFSNVTIIGPLEKAGASYNANFQHAAQIRRNSSISILNSVFVGYTEGINIDDSKTVTPGATSTNFTKGDLVFKNNIIYGTKTNQIKFQGKTPATVMATITAKLLQDNDFNTDKFGASLYTAAYKYSADLTKGINVGRPDFTLVANSPAATGALFTDAKVSDPFFTKVAYKGAFGTDDWTAKWANFDPQTTPYTTAGQIN